MKSIRRSYTLARARHGFSKRGGGGFSLIEVMVAMVVLSIGLLSLAALQAAAVRHSYVSFQRSVANLHVQDAVERLWTNRCALRNGSVLNTVLTEWDASNSDMSGNKLYLPNWAGQITGTQGLAVPIGTYTITVTWTERPTVQGQTGPTQTFTHTANIPFLNC